VPARRSRTRRIVRGLVLLAALLLVTGVSMFSVQRLFMYPRSAVRSVPHPGEGVEGLERLSIETNEGQVEAWLLPAHTRSGTGRHPAVIFAHGNAELIDHWPAEMERYRRMGLSVLLPEFRGYGRSAGSPSQAAIVADFERFHDLLLIRPEIDPRRVVYHGRSLGGGVVCALAARRPPAALILQSSFTSMRRMARRFLMPGFLVLDPYDNLSVVQRLSCPVLVFHGGRDRLIPFEHGKQLAEAAADRGLLVAYPEADHNDCPPDWGQFWDHVERFLRRSRIVVDS